MQINVKSKVVSFAYIGLFKTTTTVIFYIGQLWSVPASTSTATAMPCGGSGGRRKGETCDHSSKTWAKLG